MNRSRVLAGIVGALVMSVAAFVTVSFDAARQEAVAQAKKKQNQKQAAKAKAAGNRAVEIPDNAIGLNVEFGIKDKTPTDWNGAVQVSEGKVLLVEIARGGGTMATVEDNKFTVRTTQPAAKKAAEGLGRPVISVMLVAPPNAKVTIDTKQGQIAFALSDLPMNDAKEFLDGQVSVERQLASTRLTDPDTEDDYPAVAKAADGSVWMAYVEYTKSEQPLNERVLAGNFEGLEPKGNGDRIKLRHFDGKTWSVPVDVTDGGLDVWRPTVTIDGKGRVVIAWAEKKNDNWDIYCRHYTPGKDGAKGELGAVARVSNGAGTDFNVVSATDSNGVVHFAWQGWNNDNFDIMFSSIAGDKAEPPAAVWKPRVNANEWSPSIATDSKGNIYVAFDTYVTGDYNVRMERLSFSQKDGKPVLSFTGGMEVATSPKFEARPHIVCDAKDRVWIAYDEGNEQWGKDYSTAEFAKIPFEKNPGYALYIDRTVKVKCFADGKLQVPAGNLEKAVAGKMTRNKSVPRLAVDTAGGVWLFVRHHPLPAGAGEVWVSFATRFDGKDWSAPRKLTNSDNLLHITPALAASGKGILAVYSGDDRDNTANRKQADIFSTVVLHAGETSAPMFVADDPPAAATVAEVHPNEKQDLARIRAYRVESGGKQLKLLRGEFHRHTEYSAHRDADGLLEDSLRYALDTCSHDWMGNGDHDNGQHHEFMWWQIQKQFDMIHNPPTFVAAMTYERSVAYPNGHRNVMMPRRGIRPLVRGDLDTGTPEKPATDTKILYSYLEHFGGICSSHTSGTNMGTNWRDNNPKYEPVVEIYQGHRHNYEHFGAPRSATEATNIGGWQPSGFIWNAFDKGYRLGFQSSSDHISTHISYGIVFAEDTSRQAIIDAFKKRHSYAATDNIILDVHSGTHLMGDEFTTKERPSLTIHAEGTAPVAKVSIIRDNKYIYTNEPKTAKVQLSFTDMEATPGKTSYYYVRLEQADGNLAWASPMWITYAK